MIASLKARDWPLSLHLMLDGTINSRTGRNGREINLSDILNQGLKILSGCAMQSDIKQKEQESSVCNPEAMNAQATESGS